MSLSQEGLKIKVKSTHIHVQVKKSDSLVILCNSIDWEKVMNLAIEDLKSSTKKSYWWLGRKLFLRVHFAVFFLQALLKMTDRETEQRIVDSPRLQVFCGRGIIKSWKCPDHTKIEEFRNRLSPDTQKNLCHYILRLATNLKYVDPKHVDIDSTIQEANMAYPSDASLMKKLSLKCHNVLKFMKDSRKKYLPTYLNIDIEKIVKKARGYFFLAKNTAIERKREIFKEYHALVKKEVYPILNFLENLSPQAISALPWNQKKRVVELKSMGKKYLKDVSYFIKNHRIKEGKILSFNLKEVACFRKGKPGKENEFGRNFQVGRIGGNFLVPYSLSSVRMEDKKEFQNILKEHKSIFGQGVVETVTADKGYYSRENEKFLREEFGCSIGLQRPGNVKDQVEEGPQKEILYNRRSGVEPVIGHAKKFGLGRSRMKSDSATLASGYRSILGFNLHQLVRYLAKSQKEKVK